MTLQRSLKTLFFKALNAGKSLILSRAEYTSPPMPKKKKHRSLSQLDALRQVRKTVPPPTRAEDDEKKYRRAAAQRAVRKELERAREEE